MITNYFLSILADVKIDHLPRTSCYDVLKRGCRRTATELFRLILLLSWTFSILSLLEFVHSICVQCSRAQQGPYDRLFRQLMSGYEKSVIPSSAPSDTISVEFGLSVLCVELDRRREQLITYAWQKMVRVSYIRISLCYFCFRWKTVSLVGLQASMQHLMHHVTVSLQQSKISLQNNCINNTSITQPTLSF